MKRTAIMTVVAAAALAAVADNGTWVKRDGVGTDATNMATWSDTENWVDGVVPASIDTDFATLGTAAGQYIDFGSATISLQGISGKNGNSSTPGNETVLVGSGQLNTSYAKNITSVWLYVPWNRNGGATAMSVYTGINAASICADVTAAYYFHTLWQDSSYVRYDLYASAPGGTRLNGPLGNGSNLKINGGSTVTLRAPKGTTETINATFAQTAESAFLTPVGEVGMLPVGTTVTGEGIPADTYLKRIFPNGQIELSNPVTSTVAENSLAFLPMTVCVTQNLGTIRQYNSASPVHLRIDKYNAADQFVVRTDGFANDSGAWRNLEITACNGFEPGTLVFKGASADTSGQPVYVGRMNFEFEGDLTGPSFENMSATSEATFYVGAGRVQTLGKLKSWTVPFVKKGAGELKVGLQSTTFGSTGSVLVEEGVFAPMLQEGEEAVTIPALTVKAGAGYRPVSGVTVDHLVIEDGACLYGTEEFNYNTLDSGSLDRMVMKDGAYVIYGDQTQAFGVRIVNGAVDVGGVGSDTLLYVRGEATLNVTGPGTIDVLLVGGGGGGGSRAGGGGGGGGVVYHQSYAVQAGLYSLGVGRGGAAGDSGIDNAKNGGDSTFFNLIAHGGGAGGYSGNGHSGATGGGAGAKYGYPGDKQAGDVDGNIGGAAIWDGEGFGGGTSTNRYKGWSETKGGGGGGAGGPGADAIFSKSGNGGAGRACSITGLEVRYGGGGGAGAGGYNTTQGFGQDGGGNGGYVTSHPSMADSTPGKDGLGGGGGGGASSGDNIRGGSRGGDGIIIIRYHVEKPAVPYERGRATSTGTVTHRKGNEIHTFTANGIFTVAEDTIVDVLLVGGGGSGGYGGGGGGGAGGVNVLTNVVLFAGTYEIGVGTGGAQATAWGSHSGLPTYIVPTGAAITNLLVKGGGGGGSRGNVSEGRSGGSGGGAGAAYSAWAQQVIAGGTGEFGQGHDGGTSKNLGAGQNWATLGGGGGGAGAPGQASDGSVSPKITGVGGDGIYCDFSGRSVCYGGGGGGGHYDYADGDGYKVAGGNGGGGRGAGIRSPWNTGAYPGEAGTDGLGGGGGGGGANADNVDGGYGGKGGDGIVIIRYPVPPTGMTLLVR